MFQVTATAIEIGKTHVSLSVCMIPILYVNNLPQQHIRSMTPLLSNPATDFKYVELFLICFSVRCCGDGLGTKIRDGYYFLSNRGSLWVFTSYGKKYL